MGREVRLTHSRGLPATSIRDVIQALSADLATLQSADMTPRRKSRLQLDCELYVISTGTFVITAH